MKKPTPEELLESVLERDPRYAAEAYFFVRDALDHVVKKLERPRHVSGRELLGGIREYALAQFGPMARRVLAEWGIRECIDFGHIVFNLVDEGLLGKNDEDSIDDFADGYDFEEAFARPFQPPETVACPLGKNRIPEQRR